MLTILLCRGLQSPAMQVRVTTTVVIKLVLNQARVARSMSRYDINYAPMKRKPHPSLVRPSKEDMYGSPSSVKSAAAEALRPAGPSTKAFLKSSLP